MDFFPELREKVGVDKTGLTEIVTVKGDEYIAAEIAAVLPDDGDADARRIV